MEFYQKISAILFLLLLFGFAGYNLYQEGEIVYDEIAQLEVPAYTETKTYTAGIDTVLITNLAGDHFWNEVYGTVCKALGKNEENGFTYVRDRDGVLYYANLWNTTDVSMEELAKRVKRLQEDTKAKGTKVVMLLYPTKYDENWSDGYYGIPYQDMNDLADEFLMYLRRYGVDYLDYREILQATGKSASELFFKTDHHWTVETSFDATVSLVEFMRERFGEELDPEGFYCDINNYVIEEYKGSFLGSQGREAGLVYSGVDDYTFILPNFATRVKWKHRNLTESVDEQNGYVNGTLISKGYLKVKDAYERDLNSSYLGGVYLFDRVQNMDRPEGEGLKLLFLRNSYSSCIATFLTPMVSSIDLVWTANSEENEIMPVIASGDYDYIFVALNVDNLCNDEFSFYTTPLPGEPEEGEEAPEEEVSE